jgi:hypothetical protein
MNGFLTDLILNLGMLLIHMVPFGIAWRIWSRSKFVRTKKSLFADVLAIIYLPITISLFFSFLFAGESNAATGNATAWFIIFSVATFGIFPLITLTCFYMSGRLAGKFTYWRRSKKAMSSTSFGRGGVSGA